MEGQPLAQTKEEREAIKKKKKKRYNVVLTLEEGEAFDGLLQDYGCQNASQFIKKLCSGELTIKQDW